MSVLLLLFLLLFLDDDAVDIQRLLLFLLLCLVKMCLWFLLPLLLVWMLFLHVGGGIGVASGCSACCGIGWFLMHLCCRGIATCLCFWGHCHCAVYCTSVLAVPTEYVLLTRPPRVDVQSSGQLGHRR